MASGQTTPAPSDLAAPRLSPDDCFIWGEEGEFGIQSNRPRATAISHFAAAEGIRFQDVVCRRRYMRLLTRQQSYGYRAGPDRADTAAWDWAEEHGYRYRDDAFRDDEGVPHEPPPFDPVVPADWQADEDDPVWEFCAKDAPGAMPCWELEAKR
jgi:hypothetical protein